MEAWQPDSLADSKLLYQPFKPGALRALTENYQPGVMFSSDLSESTQQSIKALLLHEPSSGYEYGQPLAKPWMLQGHASANIKVRRNDAIVDDDGLAFSEGY